MRWRADANGVTHATLSDDQGDAADRLPQSVFPFAAADCALAGESARFGAAWVVVDRPARDKPHWFYVDKSSGLIEHEITREGARTVVTSFRQFEPLAGTRRPRHWRVEDGNAAHTLDVDVDTVVARARRCGRRRDSADPASVRSAERAGERRDDAARNVS